MDHLDEFDHRLLSLLSLDSRQTGKQLSEKVGLSPAACLRRVQRLRQIGAIEREIAILSPEIRGASVTLLVMLELTRGDPGLTDELRRTLQKLREVQKIYHVTGDSDFVLILECASMEAYATFTEAHFYNGEIKGFDTIVVLRAFDPNPA